MHWSTVTEEPVRSALQRQYPDTSLRRLSHWLKEGRVTVNGQLVRDLRTLVQPGQELRVQPRSVKTNLLHGPWHLPILHQDAHLLILAKPAGLLSVPAEGSDAPCALQLLEGGIRRKLYPVHRLDRETSGALCFAKTPAAQSALRDLFARHWLVRRYHAVVDHTPSQDAGTWQSWLWEHPETLQVHDLGDPSSSPRPQAEWAVTHYNVLHHLGDQALLECTLETGKKHQIRVHAAQAGCPVLGDKRYGSGGRGPMMLHASYLGLEHPCTGHWIEASAPPPTWLQRALKGTRSSIRPAARQHASRNAR